MKKLFILIGLFVCIGMNAQTFDWSVLDTATSDTTVYDKRGNANNWFGTLVTIDITIWDTDGDSAMFYFGGYDNKVTINTGEQDFKYYNTDALGLSMSPLYADTTGVTGSYFQPNSDSSRYSCKLVLRNFAFKKPAYEIDMGTATSFNYFILFNAKE